MAFFFFSIHQAGTSVGITSSKLPAWADRSSEKFSDRDGWLTSAASRSAVFTPRTCVYTLTADSLLQHEEMVQLLHIF